MPNQSNDDGYDDNLRPSILATWVLMLLSVFVTFGLCIAVGGTFFAWIADRFKNLGILDLPYVDLLLGAIVYGPMIAPGLLFFWLGTKVLACFGLRPYDSTRDS